MIAVCNCGNVISRPRATDTKCRCGNSQNTREVIARAFGDEPLKLTAKRAFDGVVELEAEGAPALFLENDVFLFDAVLFKKLKKTFEAGDQNTLTRLWSEARNVA